MLPTRKKKQKKTSFILGFFIVCIFALIVQMDLSLPKWVLIPGALIGALLLLGASFKSPLPAFYVMTCYIPFSKILVGDFGSGTLAFNLTNLLMILVLLGMMARKADKDIPMFSGNHLNIPILLFCMISLLSFVRASFFYGGDYDVAGFIIQLKRWLTPILLFFLAYNSLEGKESVKNSIKIVMLVVFLAGLMATWDYMNLSPGTSFEKARIGGITKKSNQLAAFFVYYMFLYWGFFLMRLKSFSSWWLVAPILATFRGLQVTFSRGGYLAFAFAVYVITFIRSKFLFFMLCVITVLLILNPILLPSGVRYRMGMTLQDSGDIYDSSDFEGSLEASSQNRIEVWRAGFEMIKDEPLFGFGYGSFPTIIGSYNSNVRGFDAHNSYIILAAEMGIPSLVIFLLIIAVFWFETMWVYRRSKDAFFKATALGMLGGIAGLLIVNIFGSRLNSLEVSGYFWILAGIILRIKHLEKTEGKKKEKIKR